MKVRYIAPLLAVGAIAPITNGQSQELQPFSPFVADSFKCQSTDDKGATCDRTECTTAPSNYAYWKDSLNAREISGAGNGARWCKTSLMDMRKVPVALPTGAKVDVDLPGKVCVNAHAETGSGVGNISVTAWIQCELTGQWVQVK